MPTISDITQGASYQGNAALGGFLNNALILDTKPLETLAAYSVMYRKSLWDQKNKDAADKIQQLAALTKYDLTAARGKDKDVAIKAKVELDRFARQYAYKGVPKDAEEKVLQELELGQKTSEAIKKITLANARGITYNARLDLINKDTKTNSDQKALLVGRLNKKFDSSNWDEPLDALPAFNARIPEIPKPKLNEIEAAVMDNGGNHVNTIKWTGFIPAQNTALAAATVMGANKLRVLPPDATQEQKDQLAFDLADDNDFNTFTHSQEAYNQALPDYIDPATGKVDENKIKANGVISPVYDQIKAFNKYNREMKADATRRYKIIGEGRMLDLSNVIRPDDFYEIDENAPITAENLVMLDLFGQSGAAKREDQYIQTNERLKEKDLQKDWYTAVTGRINANKPSSSSGGGSVKTSDLIQDPAIHFGRHIQRLGSYFERKPSAQTLPVAFAQVDNETRKAVGLTDGQFIEYKRDGSYDIKEEKTKKVISTGTIDGLKKGFIDAVKLGKDEDGSLTEGFQVKSEEGFTQIYGTNDAKSIFNAIMSKATVVPGVMQIQPPTPAKGGSKALSDAEYKAWLKSKGY